jgi:hypothetical protein
MSTPELSLRELCFDLAAGLLDRAQFCALVRDSLRQWMRCEDVQVRCAGPELTPLLRQLAGQGWAIDPEPGQRLHAAMAHNGRLIGAVSCQRAAGAPGWTAAEGALLRRLPPS